MTIRQGLLASLAALISSVSAASGVYSLNADGKAIIKAGREKIELIWSADTVFPKGKTAADYTLQVVNGQLVVANKAVGIAIIIK